MERKFAKQLFVALFAFSAFIAAFVIWNPFTREGSLEKEERLLLAQGSETEGRVLVQNTAAHPTVTYHFVANNRGYTATSKLEVQPLIVLSTGMPLESGDEFTVLYAASRPDVNRILFNRPTERQLEIYRQRAAEKHARLHPEEAPPIVACMVKVAQQLYGVGGIANFYFQDARPETNAQHNQNTFLRMTRDLPFQKRVEKDCW